MSKGGPIYKKAERLSTTHFDNEFHFNGKALNRTSSVQSFYGEVIFVLQVNDFLYSTLQIRVLKMNLS